MAASPSSRVATAAPLTSSPKDLVAVFFKGYHLDEIEGHQVGEHLPVVVLAASLVLELQHNLLCNENLVR